MSPSCASPLPLLSPKPLPPSLLGPFGTSPLRSSCTGTSAPRCRPASAARPAGARRRSRRTCRRARAAQRRGRAQGRPPRRGTCSRTREREAGRERQGGLGRGIRTGHLKRPRVGGRGAPYTCPMGRGVQGPCGPCGPCGRRREEDDRGWVGRRADVPWARHLEHAARAMHAACEGPPLGAPYAYEAMGGTCLASSWTA